MTEEELHKYLMDTFMPDKKSKINLSIGPVDMGDGNYCYHIGGGTLTGQKGWDMFQKMLEEEAKKYLDTKE